MSDIQTGGSADGGVPGPAASPAPDGSWVAPYPPPGPPGYGAPAPYGAAVPPAYAGAGYSPLPPLSSPGRRLGQAILDGVLAFVTLGIGWIIWSLFIWRRGETPGMQILRMKVVKAETAQPATWGTMFLREFVGKYLIMGVIGGIFFPAALVLDCMLLWDGRNQELWDKVAGTVVVDNR